ncbi:MAG: lipopolysaccharide heptosyltransferase II [Phycisphaerae bacterium]|nr:lipopolysaccharide heptosyltransferase II [Phycisphaerae bacterium]
MSSVENILVFLPNWVGDVVMATPVLRTLRENNPSTKITLFGKPVALSLLEGSSWCDSQIADSSRSGMRGFFHTVKKLRGVGADTALLLPNSFRSAVLARFSGAKRRIGYARDGRGFLLTDALKPQRRPKDSPAPGKYLPIPTSQYYAKLLQPLGISYDNLTMELPLTEQDHAAAADLLTEVGYDPTCPLVMLNPGAAFGTSKLWAAERYAKLADKLVEQYNAQIILNGAPNENERSILTKLMGEMQHKPLIDFANRDNTLGLLKGLMLRCQMLVTNDTGARHIAAAMGIGVVTIFGSTDPVWAQIDYPRERIVRIDIPCSPCQQKICPLPQGDEHHKCMTGISVDTVLQAADEIIDSRDKAEVLR